jgi:ribosomal protein S18 acetylase RimI-like enzyme
MSANLAASGMETSELEHLRRVRAAFDHAMVVTLSDEAVGLLKVVRESQQWELVQIQLAPSVQGRGLGTALLRALISEARSNGVSLRLGVLKANPARRLYERLGFKIVAEKEHSYEMALAV